MRHVLIMVVISLCIALAFTGVASTVLHSQGRIAITRFAVERSAVRPGERVRVSVATEDRAGGPLHFLWKADGGAVSGPATDTVVWQAPAQEGCYRIGVTVVNAVGARTGASADILVSRYSRPGRI